MKEHSKEFNRKNFAIFRSLLTPNIFILMTRYESLSENIAQKNENQSSNMQEKLGGFEILDNGFYSIINSNDPKNSLKNKYAVIGQFTMASSRKYSSKVMKFNQFESNSRRIFSYLRSANEKK